MKGDMNTFEVEKDIEDVETKLYDLMIKLNEINDAVRKLAERFEKR